MSNGKQFKVEVHDEAARGINGASIVQKYKDVPESMRAQGKSELEIAQMFYNHAVEEIHSEKARRVAMCNDVVRQGLNELGYSGEWANLSDIIRHAMALRIEALRKSSFADSFLLELYEIERDLCRTGVPEWQKVLERATAMCEKMKDKVASTENSDED